MKFRFVTKEEAEEIIQIALSRTGMRAGQFGPTVLAAAIAVAADAGVQVNTPAAKREAALAAKWKRAVTGLIPLTEESFVEVITRICVLPVEF